MTDDIKPVTNEMNTADYWINKDPKVLNTLLMNNSQISQFNSKYFRQSPYLQSLFLSPEFLSSEELIHLFNTYTRFTGEMVYKSDSTKFTETDIDSIRNNIGFDKLHAHIPVRYGITVRRCLQRMIPYPAPLYRALDSKDIDRSLETAIYPNEPVLIYHVSRDKKWYFARIYNCIGWVPVKDVALITKSALEQHLASPDFVVVITNRLMLPVPKIHRGTEMVQCDLGTRIILQATSPFSWSKKLQLKFPARRPNGWVRWATIPISPSPMLHKGWLPYTRANILRTAFTCLGEPYGWGGMYDARDCSALIQDIHRCFGIYLPRNAGQQSEFNPGTQYEFKEDWMEFNEQRLDNILPGTIIFLRGHVVIYLGKDADKHYIIHDVHGFYRRIDDQLIKQPYSGVVVTDTDIRIPSGKKYSALFYTAWSYYPPSEQPLER